MVATDGGVPYKPVRILERVPASSGPLRSLALLLVAPVLWGALLLILAREFLRSPLAFFRRTPRPKRPEDLALPPELTDLVHEWLDVGGGVRLHAASFGRRPDKPLLLFLHGFPECWYSWRDLMAQLRHEYEVVALDMRGFGWSDKPQGISQYTLAHLTADVAGAVRALGRASCTLVAHDWGGAVAWAAAGRYPALVERLAVMAAPHWLLYKRNLNVRQMLASSYFVMFQMPIFAELLLTHTDGALFEDMWHPTPDPHPTLAADTSGAVAAGAATGTDADGANGANGNHGDKKSAATAAAASGGGRSASGEKPPPLAAAAARVRRAALPHPAAPRTRGAFSDGDVSVYKAAMLQPGAATASLNYYRALMACDSGLVPFDPEVERGLRRQLEMPVLVVWGAEDHALRLSNLVGVAEVAPRSEVHILPGCSHWVQADAPTQLRRIMREWLAANPLRDAS